MIKRVFPIAAVLAAIGAFAVAGVAQSATRHHKAIHHSLAAHRSATTPGATDGDSLQSGDLTTPDAGTAAEEPGSEAVSDGPGGHEDTPGAEVDNQFEGEQ
jgi:hypothetical protein